MTAVSEAARPTTSAVPGFSSYHHLGLTVRDIAASEQWYTQVLGFVRAFVEPHHNGTGYAVVMNRPGTHVFLGLDHHVDTEPAPFAANRAGLDHLAIGVDERADLDAWVAHLDERGVEHGGIVEASEPMPHAVLNFRDPDGIALELLWLGHGP